LVIIPAIAGASQEAPTSLGGGSKSQLKYNGNIVIERINNGVGKIPNNTLNSINKYDKLINIDLLS
jgi:hypothetical protein